jgi:uncharacterized protein
MMTPSYVIITGALGGLGSAFAFEFACQGYNLILVDRLLNGETLTDFLSERFQIETRYFSCDLADHTARSDLLLKFERQGFLLDGLVNVVGQEMEGKFLSLTRDEILYMIHLNIETMIDLTSFALKQHNPGQRFLLINVASLAGFFPIPHKALYSASKRFIIHFSQALREEIHDFGNVTVLCPGGLPTNPEAMKKIFLQGFWGKITAHDTHQIAKCTLAKAQRNVSIYTPGLSNKFLKLLARLLPTDLVANYLSKRWKGKQSFLDYWRLLNQTQNR